MDEMSTKNFEKILEWAFKRSNGFQEADLMKEFNLDQDWYLKTFRPNPIPSENLIQHSRYDSQNEKHFFILSEKGISKYLNLKKPWHEKFLGKVFFIFLGALITMLFDKIKCP